MNFHFCQKCIKSSSPPTITSIGYFIVFANLKASLVAQRLKHLPGMWETRVRSLGQEDSLEKEMAPTPVLLPGESHGGRSLVGYSPWRCKESDTTELLYFHFQVSLYLKTLLNSVESKCKMAFIEIRKMKQIIFFSVC